MYVHVHGHVRVCVLAKLKDICITGYWETSSPSDRPQLHNHHSGGRGAETAERKSDTTGRDGDAQNPSEGGREGGREGKEGGKKVEYYITKNIHVLDTCNGIYMEFHQHD